MRNGLLGAGFLVVFSIVVMTYPTYADNDAVVLIVVGALMAIALGAIVLSGSPKTTDDDEP
jgi:tetrahydromethanopterin S-methyltransferase subunit E